MFERERQMEMEKMKTTTTGFLTQAVTMETLRSRQLMAQTSPREFMQRIFPTVNPNVLELVYQGCGGNLERAIEQIVSNGSAHGLQSAQQVAQQQQLAVQQRLAAVAAAATATAAAAAAATSSSAKQVAYPPQLVEQLKQAHSAFTPQIRAQQTLSQRPLPAHLASIYPAPYPATLLARMAYPTVVVPQPCSPGTGSQGADDLLTQRSAFQPSASSSSSPRSPTSESRNSLSPASLSPCGSRSGTFSDTEHSPIGKCKSPVVPAVAKSPLKFSVESIIGTSSSS